jgi:hypothetical protein
MLIQRWALGAARNPRRRDRQSPFPYRQLRGRRGWQAGGNPPFLTGSCVVAVDGKPVERCRDSFVTVIPMVELEPGRHAITLGLPGETRNPRTVTGDFEAGRSYRIKSQDGVLSIVETEDNRETASEG